MAPWKVAIIGGGPGGLAAAIALGQLNAPENPPVVEWTLYEKKPRISETGGGITLQRHTWRLLERFGVAERIDARDFFRPENGTAAEHRDAITGVLLDRKVHASDTPLHETSCRILRAKLQHALLSAADESRIVTDRRVVGVEEAPDGSSYRLRFGDGTSSEPVDLVIGADGIRSVVRQIVAPGHTLQYNGQSAYRTILRTSDVAAINGIPRAGVFWQYVGGKYIFTSPLGGDDFELTARIRPDEESDHERANHVSWGQPYDLNKLLPQYSEFAPPLRAILRLAADKGGTQEFALFNGPRLTTCVHLAASRTAGASTAGIVLLGDASHPLSGAFGAGAGFAFEDAYTLARALSWAHAGGRPLAKAVTIYDRARSPHYANLYDTLDRGGAAASAVAAEKLPLHDEIAERVKRVWAGENGAGWVYQYRADEVVEQIIQEEEKKEGGVPNLSAVQALQADPNGKSAESSVLAEAKTNGIKQPTLIVVSNIA